MVAHNSVNFYCEEIDYGNCRYDADGIGLGIEWKGCFRSLSRRKCVGDGLRIKGSRTFVSTTVHDDDMREQLANGPTRKLLICSQQRNAREPEETLSTTVIPNKAIR
ncbi:hypothetical protein CBL_01641 [Carabus blaptoides fortunei]